MKKSRIIIAIMLLVCMLNISVVCNAEDKQPGTFTQLSEKIATAISNAGNDDEIYVDLDNNYKFDYDVDYNLYEGIVIEKPVIINGNGYTIDGDNQARMFTIMGQSNVSINNVAFKHGYGCEANYKPDGIAHIGGAIIVENFSTLTLNGCEFVENAADNGYGSTVFITGDSSLNIADCVFTDNGDDNTAVLYAIDGKTINVYRSNIAASDIGQERGDMGYDTSVYLYTMPQVEFTVADYTIGSNASLEITQPANFTGTAAILTSENDPIEGVQFTNGKATADLNLPVGTFTAYISTDEVEYAKEGLIHFMYSATEGVSNEFKVLKKANLKINAKNISYGEKAVVAGTVDGTGSVTIKLNGRVVASNVAVNNGAFTYSIPNLNVGNYTVEALYSGDSDTGASIASAKFTVGKLNTKIDAGSVSAYYQANKNVVATLKDSNGNALASMKITVILNGKTKTYTTDSKGRISVPVSSLKPKTYTATLKFAGSDKYKASSTTTKINVTKATPKITAANKTYKKTAKTKKYTVTLKSPAGKAIAKTSVSVNVNGKTYSAKTNNKGTATITLKNMAKVGTYKTKIMFKGNSCYKSATKTTKITIK